MNRYVVVMRYASKLLSKFILTKDSGLSQSNEFLTMAVRTLNQEDKLRHKMNYHETKHNREIIFYLRSIMNEEIENRLYGLELQTRSLDLHDMKSVSTILAAYHFIINLHVTKVSVEHVRFLENILLCSNKI